MNAAQAVQENQKITLMLLNGSKEMAKRLNISVIEAINKKVAVYEKYSKTSNEAIAWNLRGEEAKQLI